MTEKTDLIDMEEILEIMDHDTELIQDCFGDFVKEYPGMLKSIAHSIATGNVQGLDSHAHKLKGSLRYLAAAKPADIASKLEQKGKKGDFEGAVRLLEELSDACEQLKTFMISYKG
ncbi:MAG: Hpt domain-containing protein [Pseudomonadota bacterium]